MSTPLFNGTAIFGICTKEDIGDQAYRALKSALPGVDGVRVYRMGKGTQIFTIEGRLVATTRAGLSAAIQGANALRNGVLHAYTAADGTNYANCLLNSFTTTSHV